MCVRERVVRDELHHLLHLGHDLGPDFSFSFSSSLSFSSPFLPCSSLCRYIEGEIRVVRVGEKEKGDQVVGRSILW